MYRNNKNRRVVNTSKEKKPVFLSQNPIQANEAAEKENNIVPSSQDQDIPSSQNEAQSTLPSQSRFLSQRHQVSRLTQEQQIRGKNFFEICLVSCKIKISDLGCELMIEGDDPISFIRRFRSFLGSNNDNAKKFLDGFKKAFSLKEDAIRNSQKFLSGCIMRESQKTYQSQTSLVQCFFAVESLKDEIAKFLLDNLKSYVVDRGEQADGFIVGLVVAQFKFSDQLLSATTYDVMYEQFFAILEQSKNEACREVIITNFRDLDEFKQDAAVKRLLSMYEDDYELLTPFIETFTEMCISEDTKAKVTSLVHHFLEKKCVPTLYPGIVKYLLCYMQSAAETVDSLRINLKWYSESNSKWNTLKMKVIQLLEKSVRREKSKISEAWLKSISMLEKPEDLKVIDFIMLLVIVSVKEEKFPAIKKILLQKVPQGLFSSEYLKKVFQIFPLIIAQYSETLLELLNGLQKNNIYEINEFSSTCFKELFAINSSDKKEIIGSLVQFLCEKVPQLPFTSKSDFKMMTLNILGEIVNNQSSAESLLVHHKILLRVLDTSKVKLTFYEYRVVMELLCKLSYATNYRENHNNLEAEQLEEERAVLQDHLEMMTNKLMCNPDLKIKQLGIIGAIKIVSALVVNVVTSSEVLEDRSIEIDDIPAGPIKDAARRVEFIFQSVRGNPQGFAMVCDEISLEFQCKREEFVINEIFLNWLSDLLLDKLYSTATVKIASGNLPEAEGFTFVNKLADDKFSQPEHALKLATLVFVEKNDDVIFVAALFKVTRLLSQHRHRDLSQVMRFSVMPITLTDTFATTEDELSSDDVQAKQNLDLYFHCINWLRELIGTFCHWTEKDQEDLTECVIRRVKQLVMVEKRLGQLLTEVPANYYPPPATFLEVEAKKKAFDGLRKEKKVVQKPLKKSRKKNDSTIANTSEAQTEEAPETTNKIRQFCREIDTQFILLLREDFKFTTADIGDVEFGLNELTFLLDDIYHKVNAVCNSRNAEQKGFFDPIRTIHQLKETVILYLVKIFHKICDELVSLSQIADRDDANDGYYTKDANMLKNCFSLILQLFDVVFSCPQLKLEKNSELLKEALKSLIPVELLQEDVDSRDMICFFIINHCAKFERNVKNCEGALALVKFLQTISKFSTNEENHALVHELCENFLKKEWKNSAGQEEQGAVFNANLEKLLQIFVGNANFELMEGLVEKMSEDFKDIAGKQLSYQNNFPSFNKGNSMCMVRTYMTRLSLILASSEPAKLNYAFWAKCIQVYIQFGEIVKCIGSQNVSIVFIKNFLVLLRVFNIHGITTLKQVTKHTKKFVDLVKSVQSLTRFSHGVSCDLIHRKNKSIVSLIPKLREALMKNFQAMSALLPMVNLKTSEINLGILKNFDMNGEEILSQNSNAPYGSSDEEQEEEAMDVSSDDETVGNINVSADANSQAHHSSFRSRSTIL